MKRSIQRKRLLLKRDVARILLSMDQLQIQVVGGGPTTSPPNQCNNGTGRQSECC